MVTAYQPSAPSQACASSSPDFIEFSHREEVLILQDCPSYHSWLQRALDFAYI